MLRLPGQACPGRSVSSIEAQPDQMSCVSGGTANRGPHTRVSSPEEHRMRWPHQATRRDLSFYCLLAVLASPTLTACDRVEEMRSEPTLAVRLQEPTGELRLVENRVLGPVGGGSDAAMNLLGKPRAASQFGDRILVLDSDWKRIFSFDTSTSVDTIGNGYGIRPGDLALPVEMSLLGDRVHVLDYELKSVTIWHVGGGLERVIDLGDLHSRGLVATREGLFVRLMYPSRGSWAVRISEEGEVLDRLFPFADHDEAYSDAGYGGTLIASWDGERPIYVHGNGSVARTLTPVGYVDVNLEPVGAIRSDPEGRTWAETAVFDAVHLPGDRLLVLRSRRARSPAEDIGSFEVALYEGDGSLVGIHRFAPGSMPLAIDRAEDPAGLLVSFLLPKPVVKAYSIEVVQ